MLVLNMKKKNLPQFLIGLAFGLSFSIIAYGSGKKAGVLEVVEASSVISTGHRYDGLLSCYESNKDTLDEESKKQIETSVREAHKEFMKHLAFAKESGTKHLGLVSSVTRELPSSLKETSGQEAEPKP